jgi:hypothetical protein
MSKKLPPIPEHLRLVPKRDDTPEKKAEIAARLAMIREQQARLRAEAEARGRLSPEARRMQVGLAHERSARSDFEMLKREVRRTKGEEKTEKQARLGHARSRLAEALACQGRYDEAAATECDKEKKAHYRMMWKAVWCDDDHTCPCVPFVDGELSLTHDHVAEEVISQKHGNKIMPAVRCNACGSTNVRPLTHELKQLERHRATMQRLVHGRSGEDLRANLNEILAELVDRKVLRA